MRRKLNRNYVSFFDSLPCSGKKEIANVPDGYGYRYHDGIEDGRYIYTPGIIPLPELGPENNFYYLHQLSGMQRPLVKMAKDFTDTFEPYYTPKKHRKDWLQPINGVKNILKGAGSLLGGVMLTAIIVALLPLALCSPKDTLIEIIYPLTWIVRGVLDIFRGITQVVFTPFVYLIKIPLRWSITNHKCRTHNIKTVEMKPEIKRLASKARDYFNELKSAKDTLTQEKKAGAVRIESAKKELVKIEAALECGTNTDDNSAGKTDLRSQKKRLENIIEEESRKEPKAVEYYIETLHRPMRILYEVNRKFNRSIHDGWKSNLNVSQLKKTYDSLYRFYRSHNALTVIAVNKDFINGVDMNEQNDKIYDKFMKDADTYLKFLN